MGKKEFIENIVMQDPERYLTFDKIKEAIQKKGYVFFEGGDFDLNFVWIRTSNKITNYFTDFLAVLYYVGKEQKMLFIPATTKPGIKGSIDSPVTVEGVTGTAIILPGQYRSTWQFSMGNSSKNYPWNYPHFFQVKGVNMYRDSDKDLQIDEELDLDNDKYKAAIQYNKIYGICWHSMSPLYYTGLPIDNWSLGCLGAEKPNWDRVINITKMAAKEWGNVFTGTILMIEDII